MNCLVNNIFTLIVSPQIFPKNWLALNSKCQKLSSFYFSITQVWLSGLSIELISFPSWAWGKEGFLKNCKNGKGKEGTKEYFSDDKIRNWLKVCNVKLQANLCFAEVGVHGFWPFTKTRFLMRILVYIKPNRTNPSPRLYSLFINA